MQDIMPPVAAGSQLIQSYGADGFRIGNQEYSTHVLVLTTQTHAWDGTFSTEALAPLWQADPAVELVIIGTGVRHELLSPEHRAALKAHGVGVETMDTGAACRTFNILLAEGRRVAVLLQKR